MCQLVIENQSQEGGKGWGVLVPRYILSVVRYLPYETAGLIGDGAVNLYG